MEQEIFRKKSLDRIKSPENLNDYVSVTNPGVWLLLAAIIVLLAGACVWGVFGHVESSVAIHINVTDGKAVCYYEDGRPFEVSEGMNIECGDVACTVTSSGDNGTETSVDIDLPDGVYNAKVILEDIHPISFVLN